MVANSKLPSKANNIFGVLSLVWVVADFATSSTFGIGPWLSQDDYPVAYLWIYLAGRLILLSLPFLALWYGLVSFRSGASRREAIACIAAGIIFSIGSFYFAMNWLSLQRNILRDITEYRPAVEITEVAKSSALPMEKRAEITVILAQMKYVNEGAQVNHLRPDGTWQTFTPSSGDVAERQERVAAADRFKGSIVLCIVWAIYAVVGFIVALIAGLKWKIGSNEN